MEVLELKKPIANNAMNAKIAEIENARRRFAQMNADGEKPTTETRRHGERQKRLPKLP
jgi:hypothetical protein